MSEALSEGKPLRDWLKSLGSGEEAARQEAVQALRRLGPTAVPELIGALKDEEWQARTGAAVALGLIGPEAKAAVPALIEALLEEDKYLRGQAATALGRLGPEARAAVPALTEALQDEE